VVHQTVEPRPHVGRFTHGVGNNHSLHRPGFG